MNFKDFYANFILEAPLVNMDFHGEFDKKTARGFDPTSRRILAHPEVKRLFADKFDNTEYDFDLRFVKSAEASQYVEYGMMSLDDVRKNLNLPDYEPTEDAINVIFTNNVASEKKPLTPWIVAHRIGHVSFASRSKDYGIGRIWEDFEESICLLINELAIVYGFVGAEGRICGKTIRDRDTSRWSDAFIGKLLAKAGTFRSARREEIPRPHEFMHEVFAQYIINGSVKYNDYNALPDFKFGRQVYKADPEKSESYMTSFSNTHDYYVSELLGQMVDRIFVM